MRTEETLKRKSRRSAVESHPLNALDFLKIEMEFDGQAWVTYLPQLHNISTFGDTPEDALDNTSEMLVGWLKSMVDRGEPVPLTAPRSRKRCKHSAKDP